MELPAGRKLRRTPDDSVLTGCLGGLARYFGLDPGRVRIGFVVMTLLSAGFPGIAIYLGLWFMIPAE